MKYIEAQSSGGATLITDAEEIAKITGMNSLRVEEIAMEMLTLSSKYPDVLAAVKAKKPKPSFGGRPTTGGQRKLLKKPPPKQ
jgi:hypothetical protein